MEIRTLTTIAERAAAYRLRYDVYVEEMGLDFPEADHDRGLLSDELDEQSTVFGAFRRGVLIGTARMSIGEASLGECAAYYRLRRRPWYEPRHVSTVTRLIVAAAHRRTAASVRLAMQCYRLGLERDVRTDVVDIQTTNERYFRRLGYLPFMEDFVHPVFGLSRPMRLRVRDRDHLAEVSSPFLRELDAWEQEAGDSNSDGACLPCVA